MHTLKNCVGFALAVLTFYSAGNTAAQDIVQDQIFVIFEDGEMVQAFQESFAPIGEIISLDSVTKGRLLANGATHLRKIVDRPVEDLSGKQLTVRHVVGLPQISTSNIAVCLLAGGRSVEEACVDIDTIPGVFKAEVISIGTQGDSCQGACPNDENFNYENSFGGRNWAFYNFVDSDIDMNMPQAWEIETGSPDVKIAVFDSGFWIDSPEFSKGLFVGPEWKIWDAYDFVDGDHNVTPVSGTPSPRHGSACAAIIGGFTNNKVLPPPEYYNGLSAGIAGGWSYDPETGTGDMGCKLAFYRTDGYVSHFISAVDRARNIVGAKAVNYSYYHPTEQGGITSWVIAIWEAYIDDFQVFSIMGNTQLWQTDPTIRAFPAGFTDLVIAVGATNPSDKRVNYYPGGWASAIGPHIDVAAPGEYHWTLVSPDDASSFCGTSCAAPMAAGVAALLLSANPDLTPSDVERILELTAEDIEAPGFDDETGHGRIDAYAALKAITLPNIVEFYTAADGYGTGNDHYAQWHFMISDISLYGYRVETKKQVTFSREYHTPPLVWGRMHGSSGAAPSDPYNENYEIYWTGVDETTITTTGCEFVSYTYHLMIPYFGWCWFPCEPEDIVFSYSVAGEPVLVAPSGYSAVWLDRILGIFLVWSDNCDNEEGYIVERKDATNQTWEVLDSLPANSTNLGDGALVGSETYTYRVKAYTCNQPNAPYTGEMVIKARPNPVEWISTSLTFCNFGDQPEPSNMVQVSWGPPQNQKLPITHYMVWRAETEHDSAEACFGPFTDSSFTGCHELDQDYRFSVICFDSEGDSSCAWRNSIIHTGLCAIAPVEVPAVVLDKTVPFKFSLSQNSPNPFNLETQIAFSLDYTDDVELSIYNILGEKVIDLHSGPAQAGDHTISWSGTDRCGNTVASGIYFYCLTAKNHATMLHKKMVLLK